jgi:hypothetical protein
MGRVDKSCGQPVTPPKLVEIIIDPLHNTACIHDLAANCGAPSLALADLVETYSGLEARAVIRGTCLEARVFFEPMSRLRHSTGVILSEAKDLYYLPLRLLLTRDARSFAALRMTNRYGT